MRYARTVIREDICTRATTSVRRYRSVAVDSAITFILSSENVSFFSWGTKRWKVDGVENFFLAVSRKTTRANMYCKYIATKEIPEVNKVKRSSFFMIADTLTHSDAILRRAVDYVTGFLVNDSFAIIEKLITHFSGSATERQLLLVEMEVCKRYLTIWFQQWCC